MIVDEVRSAAVSLLVGFVAAGLVGAKVGANPTWVTVGSLVAAVVFYLAWCRVFRTRVCPRCGSAKERHDGLGHQRDRNCRRCGGDGRERRLGAVVQGLPKHR